MLDWDFVCKLDKNAPDITGPLLGFNGGNHLNAHLPIDVNSINTLLQQPVFDILKFYDDSEAFWSFFLYFTLWFGFLCAQASSENCETMES